MPVFKQYTESSYKWGIWKTSESLEELLALLPHKEKYEEGIGKFTAVSRKLEWLAVRVLLHDDLLATGGTMEAACKLVKKLSPKKVYVNFIIELKELHGKDIFSKDVDVESVLTL